MDADNDNKIGLLSERQKIEQGIDLMINFELLFCIDILIDQVEEKIFQFVVNDFSRSILIEIITVQLKL